MRLSACLAARASVDLLICQSVLLPMHLFAYLLIFLSAWQLVWQHVWQRIWSLAPRTHLYRLAYVYRSICISSCAPSCVSARLLACSPARSNTRLAVHLHALHI